MNCSRIIIKTIQKLFCAELKQKEYKVKQVKKEICVKFCIKYRPVSTYEWILARGWWNDKWYWTENWIFNDWKI